MLDSTPTEQQVSRTEVYSLSGAQKRLYFHYKLSPNLPVYNLPFCYKIEGHLNTKRFLHTVEGFIRKHQLFNVTICEQAGSPCLKFHPDKSYKVEFMDLSSMQMEEGEKYVLEYANRLARKCFDLSRWPLYEGKLFKLSNHLHYFTFNISHMIGDAYSYYLLLDEIARGYNTAGEMDNEGRQTPSYFDYIDTENAKMRSRKFQYALEYFRHELEGVSAMHVSLPHDFRSQSFNYLGNSFRCKMSKDLSDGIQKFLANSNGTVFNFLLACYLILLKKISNQNELVVGVPVAGRYRKEMKSVFGNFVNILPFRVDFDQITTFGDLLRHVRIKLFNLIKYQDFPLSAYLEELFPNRQGISSNMFNTAITYYKEYMNLDLHHATTTWLPIHNGTSKYDMTYIINQSDDGPEIDVEYCSSLFKRETMEMYWGFFQSICRQALDPIKAIDEFDIVSQEEREFLHRLNQTVTDYPRKQPLATIFAEMAARDPNKIALEQDGRTITYGRLNETANQLGRYLQGKGIGPEDRVAMMLDRSFQMIEGILGILKCGAAYVPIDPELPVGRIHLILDDARCKAIIVNSNYKQKLEKFEGEIIAIDHEGSLIQLEESHDWQVNATGDNLAYVMYTSGSTGRPKGVMVEQKGVSRLVINTNFATIYPEDTILQWSSYAFDGSVFEIFGALLNGAKLLLISRDEAYNIDRLSYIFMEGHVTKSFLTTALFNTLVDHRPESFSPLQLVVIGGERASEKHIRKFVERNSSTCLVNAYGPTEGTTFSTYSLIYKGQDAITIGKPVSNTQVYILDSNLHLVPRGVFGEIYIAGDGLARGYLNRDELNLGKFVYHKGISCRVYRTGDFGRLLEDGSIEYLGRDDDQVKIRGFRIELGEIESAVMQIQGIENVVVLARETCERNMELITFFTSGINVTVEEIRNRLKDLLPYYMIPGIYFRVKEMPLTANGKVDKSQLQLIDGVRVGVQVQQIAPGTMIEMAIARVWEEILGIFEIGILDNFFDLGGDSLKAIEVVSKLQVDYEVTVNDLFENQSIGELARVISLKAKPLRNRIENLKRIASVIGTGKETAEMLREPIRNYREKNQGYQSIDVSKRKPYRKILVSGAAGYLGSYLVRDLLDLTNAEIHLLITGESHQEAMEKVTRRWEFYFGSELTERAKERVFVHNGDICEKMLGLTQVTYRSLTETMDAVIHCAANVKHYGWFENFYQTNVLGTQRLLNFAKSCGNIDFHYISTMSVASGQIANASCVLFTEYDGDIGQEIENYYMRTKLEAEKLVLQARTFGINAHIFRMGNLVSHSSNGKFQVNMKDNAFYQMIRSFVGIGGIPEIQARLLDMTFIDYASRAIILLFDRQALQNEIFHVYNSKQISLKYFGSCMQKSGVDLEILPMEKFIKVLARDSTNARATELIERVLVHYDILGRMEQTQFITVSKKTDLILKKLNFAWPKPEINHIQKMIDHCKEVKFL